MDDHHLFDSRPTAVQTLDDRPDPPSVPKGRGSGDDSESDASHFDGRQWKDDSPETTKRRRAARLHAGRCSC